ncbi:hypothetical protein [Streptomyces sp. NPDC003077]|uniref:hypothetical protein n=1 Tax=Streptomyces sp. NPDC003077 TaxID=3154443 RepID=UPI0033B1253C
MLGIGETLFTTASQGLLPALVHADHLPRANGRLFTLQMLGTNFLGPILGSWLFGIGRAVPFLCDAASFVLGAALLATVPKRPGTGPTPDGTSMLTEIKQGVAWVGGTRCCAPS